jgi:alkanesulfonate monooxygenase SsuD/methylene tetrahydromethanopterin reductase-like flavin-dependent oxidoreductase (luciferase family)
VSFPPVRCYPKPHRKPHPPIILGTTGTTRSFKRIVDWGDGWMPHSVESLEAYSAGIAIIRQMAVERGRDPATIEFAMTGVEGEYRTRDEILELEEAGAQRVNIWLLEQELEGILRELDELGKVRRAVDSAPGSRNRL